MTTTLTEPHARRAADAIEELRRAEAHLSRRRQTACGPGDTERIAMRFILEQADAERPVTPRDLADHLGVTSASVTALLDRLRQGQMIEVRPHASDGRKKLVMPVDRTDDPDLIDPLTAGIRELAADLSPSEAELLAGFMDRITDLVSRECQS